MRAPICCLSSIKPDLLSKLDEIDKAKMTRKHPPLLSQFPFHFEAQTRWDDNDIYGHLNNTVHYRLFDTAVNSFLVQNNVLDFRNNETVYLVIETGCTYFAELAYPDALIVGVGITHLGNSSVRYHTALFKKGDKSAAAAGHFVHVNVDRETRQPLPIDAASRQIFQKITLNQSKIS